MLHDVRGPRAASILEQTRCLVRVQMKALRVLKLMRTLNQRHLVSLMRFDGIFGGCWRESLSLPCFGGILFGRFDKTEMKNIDFYKC